MKWEVCTTARTCPQRTVPSIQFIRSGSSLRTSDARVPSAASHVTVKSAFERTILTSSMVGEVLAARRSRAYFRRGSHSGFSAQTPGSGEKNLNVAPPLRQVNEKPSLASPVALKVRQSVPK